jgi:hypothetical protein
MVIIIQARDNSWILHQSSLEVLSAEISWASRRTGRRSENFAYHNLKFTQGILTCRKILRHGTFRLADFTSQPKEVVLLIFNALKTPSPLPGLNTRPLCPVASTLTITSPRGLTVGYVYFDRYHTSKTLSEGKFCVKATYLVREVKCAPYRKYSK